MVRFYSVIPRVVLYIRNNFFFRLRLRFFINARDQSFFSALGVRFFENAPQRSTPKKIAPRSFLAIKIFFDASIALNDQSRALI